MSPEHRARVESELELVRRLLDDHAPLLAELASRDPTPWERSACAALLHAFYNGVENVLRNMSEGGGERVIRSGEWHADLLARMIVGGGPSAFLDNSLGEQLKEYLRFRHFFRHAYTFDIQWEKLVPLLQSLPEVASRFEDRARRAS